MNIILAVIIITHHLRDCYQLISQNLIRLRKSTFQDADRLMSEMCSEFVWQL